MKLIVLALLALTAFSIMEESVVTGFDGYEYYSREVKGCAEVCPENSYFSEETWKCEKIVGSIKNCLIATYGSDYQDKKFLSCDLCEEGFQRVYVSSKYYHIAEGQTSSIQDNGFSRYICVDPVSVSIENCKTLRVVSDVIIGCDTCDDGYVWTKDVAKGDSFAGCKQATSVSDCKVYSKNEYNNAIDSTKLADATCSVCKTELKTGSKCDTTITAIDNCKEYNGSDCGVCKSGFASNDGGKTCTAVTALDGCAQHFYSGSDLKCAVCKNTHYLTWENKCATVPTSGVIISENCLEYSSDGTYVYCTKCASEFGSVEFSDGLPCQACPTKASGSVILSVSLAVIAVLFALL